MKKIKKLILVLMSFVLMFSLTGCLNKNIRNLSDSEIIKQIQTKMKEEMDKINFEVNFEDYEFKVNTGVEIQSNFGTVTIKDKRYNYDPITIYDGNFEVLQKEKIGTNPIIFVAHGYQDYVVNNIFNNQELGNNVQRAINMTGGVIQPYSTNLELVNKKDGIPGTAIVREDVVNLDIVYSTTFFYHYNEVSTSKYREYFQGKSSNEIEFSQFYQYMKFYTIVGIYVNKSDEEIELFQRKVIQFYNSEILKIVVTNRERK